MTKKLLVMFICAALGMLLSSQIAAAAQEITFTKQFKEPQLATMKLMGETYTKVIMPGTFSIAEEVGSPLIQAAPLRLLLPMGTEVESIEVIAEETIEINAAGQGIDLLDTQPIFPFQEPLPFGAPAPTSIRVNREVYNSKATMPAQLYKDGGVGYSRGYAILNMSIFPTQYIPGEGRLYYHPEMTVKVTLKQSHDHHPFYRPGNLEDRNWVRTLVDNPDVIYSYNARGDVAEYPGGLCDPDDNGGLGYDYVIVVRSALYDFSATFNWEDLMARHEAEGLECTRVKVEDILNTSVYGDEWPGDNPSKIREFMKDAYQDWEAQFILIAGDQDGGNSIQRRHMYYDYESAVESDLYWSNLDNNFNADQDSRYGEAGDGGFDEYSELWIGSLPCDVGTDVSNWLTKCFAYSDNMDQDYLENAGFYGGDTGWPSQGDEFVDYSAIKGLDDFLGPNPHYDWPYPEWLDFQYGFETWNEENSGAEFDLSVKWTAEPTNPGWQGGSTNAAITGLRNAINADNVTLIAAIAHAYSGMSMDVYDYEWEANYHNTRPFFLHDYGCHCGDMDAEDDGVLHSMLFHDDTELAFACVYNTGYGWGSYYSTGSSSAVQQKSFFDYLFDIGNSGGPDFWEMGKAQAWSKDLIAPSLTWGPADDTWRGIIQSCLLFGDPAMKLKPPVMGDYLGFTFPDGRPETIDPEGGTTVRVVVSDDGVPGTGMFYYNMGGGWISEAMTEVEPNVYDAVFPAVPCGTYIDYYFSAQHTNGDTFYNPNLAPDVTYSALSVGTPSVFWTDDFSTNQGWTGLGGAGEWEWGEAQAGGGQYGYPDPANDHSPTSDDRIIGNDLGGDYSNNLYNTYWIESPTIDCSGHFEVTFKFWRWLGVEQPAYDHAYIEAYNGNSWVEVWTNGSEVTDDSWTEISIDVSAQADSNSNFKVRFGIGPTDVGWRYCGWNIDDIEVYGFDCGGQSEPDVAIDMIPDDPPIVVPPGGSFTYTGELVNNTNSQQTKDVWVMMDVPGYGSYGPVMRMNNVPIGPNQTLSTGVTQNVPNFAPTGDYTYYAFDGDYPDIKEDSAWFNFTVSGAARGGDVNTWQLEDWFDLGENLPLVTELYGNYPNPFNPTTNISYALAQDAHVKLDIYNVLGQRVDRLVDKNQKAGYQAIQWDASQYASGVYFYKLTAGDKVFTKRMTILK
ncbi:MAG: T9SS type A sorting domain-containing protein [candidate division Zixibacteria bacterium]|nr:T9SS type A sorting domain-containing protein [candidate division Zixibacteria bacterium]